jgi:SET domain-containing protein
MENHLSRTKKRPGSLYFLVMALLEKQLIVKRSTLPKAGKGLFTKKFIPKGTRIVEYKGKLTTWKEADHVEGNNGYIYYINRNKVIDARKSKAALGRYANDARGIERINGMLNNSQYVEDGYRVFIVARRDIQPGGEIFVDYGREYWDVIKYNRKLEKEAERA